MNERTFVQVVPEGTEAEFCVDGVYFAIIRPDDETVGRILAELDGWAIHRRCQWYHENLVYDDIDEGEETKIIPVADIVSMKAGCFSSSDTLGAYLIDDTGFAGVVIMHESYSGLGMACSSMRTYGVLKTNGETMGETGSYSGHCSTEVDEWSRVSYTLVKG